MDGKITIPVLLLLGTLIQDFEYLRKFKKMWKKDRKDTCMKYLAGAKVSFSNPADKTQYVQESFSDLVEGTYEASENPIIEDFAFETSSHGQLTATAFVCIERASVDSWAISPGFHEDVYFVFRKPMNSAHFQLFGLLEEVPQAFGYATHMNFDNWYLIGKNSLSDRTSPPGRRDKNVELNMMSNNIDDFSIDTMKPRFAREILNVSVTVGKSVELECAVENLRGHKVAWVRVDTQTILSIHHNVITQNPRITLRYTEHSWFLHITNTTETDRGWYMCQINTEPMISQQGYLSVVVPPKIDDDLTSKDTVARESSNVTLTCRATGHPDPYVMWRREDNADFNYNGEMVNVVDGEVLHITKVSRLHMGNYLCIGSNGVHPAASKKLDLRVQFPPMLTISNQLEAAFIGQTIALVCHTEAYPASINYWFTARGDMVVSDLATPPLKYNATTAEKGYNKDMTLVIHNVSRKDFGSYKCVAKNSLGETDGFIKLEENPTQPTTSSNLAGWNRKNDEETRYDEEDQESRAMLGAQNSSSDSKYFDRNPHLVICFILGSLSRFIF